MNFKTVTIARNDAFNEHGADIARLTSGKLMVIYRECDSHVVEEFSRIVYRTSWDGGQSWPDRHVLVEGLPNSEGVLQKWNIPRIQCLKDGRMLIVCDTFPVPPNENCDLRGSTIVLWWSEDAGETWSEPQYTSVFGIMPDRVIELPSGAWLLATQVYMKGDQYAEGYVKQGVDGHLTQIAHRSEDEGRSWEGPFMVGKDERYELCEGSVLLLPDGELVCYMRENANKGIAALKAFSSDEGRTWDGLYPTPMSGCHRPYAGILPSGRVLVTYRYLQGGRGSLGDAEAGAQWGVDRISFFARNAFAYLETVESAKARELGKQGGIILPIDHDRSPLSDGGYTAWVTLHDETIFLVQYITDDAPRPQIRGYWFRESDF